MAHLFIFGLGYSASRLAAKLATDGWTIGATGRAGTIDFTDHEAVTHTLGRADCILSSVPPTGDADPVLGMYGAAIRAAPARWVGYLSSTGVYGDTGGAWVDESAVIGTGRRNARSAADHDWRMLRDDIRVFRLPGIYGPGRSALDKVTSGSARRIDQPTQVFSRIHVDDIAGGIVASLSGPPGIYNLADDLPASQNDVIVAAAGMLGIAPPPLQSIDEASLSPMARSFYSENRRVANGRAKRRLGWKLLYPDYRAGLRACIEKS